MSKCETAAVFDALRRDVNAEVRQARARCEGVDILNDAVFRLQAIGFRPKVDHAEPAHVQVAVDLARAELPPVHPPFAAAAAVAAEVAGPPAVVDVPTSGDSPVLGCIGDAPGVDAAAAGAASGNSGGSRFWTDADDQLLCRLYDGGVAMSEIERQLERRKTVIIGRLGRLRDMGLVGTRKRVTAPPVDGESGAEWGAERVARLIALYSGNATVSQMAADLGCSIGAISGRLARLREAGQIGKRGPSIWDEARVAALVRMFRDGRTLTEIATKLGVTEKVVRGQVQRLQGSGTLQDRVRPTPAARPQREARRVLELVERAAPRLAGPPIAVPADKAALTPSEARRRAVVSDYLDSIGDGGGWSAERDLRLCELIWAGVGPRLIEQELGVADGIAVHRFRAITRPFRDDRDHLPLDVSATVLPVLRARVAAAAGVV